MARSDPYLDPGQRYRPEVRNEDQVAECLDSGNRNLADSLDQGTRWDKDGNEIVDNAIIPRLVPKADPAPAEANDNSPVVEETKPAQKKSGPQP